MPTITMSQYPDMGEEEGKNKLIYGTVFFAMILINFGNNYIFDIPQLFENAFIKKFRITPVEISYLYAIYSIPNFVFAPLGSVLLNHTGLGLGGLLFSGIIFFSTVCMYIGVNLNSFTLVMIARAVFGIGAETLIVCQATIAEKWFTGKFLSLAIGLNNVVSLAGSALSAYLTPQLFVNSRGLQVPLFFCGLIVAVCWFILLGYFIIEYKNKKLIESEDEENDEKFSLKHLKFLGKLFGFWL